MASGRSTATSKDVKNTESMHIHTNSPVSSQTKTEDNFKKILRKRQEPRARSSHTQFYKQVRKEGIQGIYEKITENEYLGVDESVSGSSDSFHCFHGPDGKQYTEKGLLKRNLQKNLDPIPKDPKWEEGCPPTFGWDIAKKLVFLITDSSRGMQVERIISHLRDFVNISANGFKIDVLDSLITIVDYLMEEQDKVASLSNILESLLKNMENPILLNVSSDTMTHFEQLRRYMGFLGYLMLRTEENTHFDLAANALTWQLVASDQKRGPSAVQMRHTIAAAVGPMLSYTMVQMLAVVPAYRFPKYLNIAFVLACDSVENCIEMTKANIIENIFYRFNPYFPNRLLPEYDINPADPKDMNLKLGDSSVHYSTTASLLLVILKTIKQCTEQDPSLLKKLICPNVYAQRCFIWAYRYECRAYGHKSQRTSMTAIAHLMLHIFRDRLTVFNTILMSDVMHLSVRTELPRRSDWTAEVHFTPGAEDALFKNYLIRFSVDLLKTFPHNRFMVESENWLVGLMYLIDPGLSCLRVRWSNSLFADLRRTALQAMLLVVMRIDPELLMKCGLIRRLLWYIEWYSESPYELHVLYWCVRLLQTCLFPSQHEYRTEAMKTLFDTHGIIIVINLCHTLLRQKVPPVEKSQLIIAHCTRMLASGADRDQRVKCFVYPELRWPASASELAHKMLDVVLYALDKHLFVNVGWKIEVLNFLWQNVVWKPESRKKFVADNGIYKLLDLIPMSRYPVQCMALALLCDILRAGDGVGHLVTWRASLRADINEPQMVKRGSTIISLLASLFKIECEAGGVIVDDNGVIEDVDNPLFTLDVKNQINNLRVMGEPTGTSLYCAAAADMAGSRWSKAYAILQMLIEDLQQKVEVADEAYKLYKGIKLSTSDENILILVSHFMTLKMCQVWTEARNQCRHLVPEDEAILKEFIDISKNYLKYIKQQQEEILKKRENCDVAAEKDLYSFIKHTALNISLDALREVRCMARSTDPNHMAHVLLYDAVRAYLGRARASKTIQAPVIRTFGRMLDEQNDTGQTVKVTSNLPRDKPKPVEYILHPASETSVSSNT